MSEKKPILYLIPCNHFDLCWRRPFRNNMHFNGQTFIPYAKIEEYYIEDNIALCDKYPEYKFSIESVAVVREFLKNRADMKDKLFELAKEGRVFIPGTGDVIIDTNMVHGETIVRNFLMGLLWVEKNFGQKNIQAYRADAFGNSAQMPQIFLGCELKHAFNLNYAQPDGNFWKGLDGSVIPCGYYTQVGNGGNVVKYPPCPECSGNGSLDGKVCPSCSGRGIAAKYDKEHFVQFTVNNDLLEKNGVGFILLNPEEYLPKEESIIFANELKEKYDVRFVNPEEPLDNGIIDFCNTENIGINNYHSSVELNPSNTGCYVTLIETKKSMRRQEYALLANESLAVEAFLKGKEYPSTQLEEIWQDMFYSAFHDCITGTIVNAGYDEIVETHERIDRKTAKLTNSTLNAICSASDGVLSVVNPYGFPQTGTVSATLPIKASNVKLLSEDGREYTVLNLKENDNGVDVTFLAQDIAPFGSIQIKYEISNSEISEKLDKRNYIENSRYKITADNNGITSIYDKKLKTVISQSHEYRIGELIFEHDEGSPWATLSDDRKRISLANKTTLSSVTVGNGYERMTFTVSPLKKYSQHDVSAVIEVTLTEGIDRVDFRLNVNWNTFNHRLRIVFPTILRGKQVYGIPYGSIVRENYIPQYGWAGNNGDYPAINYAGIDGGNSSFAVFNKGIPSYYMEKNVSGSDIFLSLLRSPMIPTYLHEPNFYTMTDWDCMRDTGKHEFEFSLCSYDSSFADSSVVTDAAAYNAGLMAINGELEITELPTIKSENAYCTSLKLAENKDGVIARIVEYRGKSGDAEIKLPDWAKDIFSVNLLERQEEKMTVENGVAKINLRPFEIKTVLFKF